MNDASSPGYMVLLALALFIVASVWISLVAQRVFEKGSFLKGYFLGNRGLGAWALALTATVQSGGTFMGFPSLVYSHGWIVALWIASYMVVPLSGFAFVGKRLAQMSRRAGAITIPDLFRERFGNPAVGLVASLLIILFMSSMMVAQFKAGAIVMKLAWPGSGVLALSEDLPEEAAEAKTARGEKSKDIPEETNPETEIQGEKKDAKDRPTSIDRKYLVGLVIFSLTVVGYTLIGGFLASVWTDLFQSLMMAVGVAVLLWLTLSATGGDLEHATRAAVEQTGPTFALGPGYDKSGRAFLSPGLALSFFFVWVYAGFASPASMVRVMASESSEVIRRSVFLLSCYNCLIYVPLILICIAGRVLIPDLDKPDEIIPRLALLVTQDIHLGSFDLGSFITGLILAAPFGAVMATVSCYLLVIASGLVRDLYQRFLRPQAAATEIRLVTYAVMIGVGLLAIAANIRPVKYLQALVVFSGTASAATFVVPVVMAAYWRRATARGMLAGMLAGAGTMLTLYAAGWTQTYLRKHPPVEGSVAAQVAQWLGPDPMIGIADPFRPYFVLGFDPILWGLLVSLIASVAVSLFTTPPEPHRLARFFDARPTKPNPQL